MSELIKGIIAITIMLGVAGGMYGYDTWKESQPLILQEGDFAEIYYIGYFENGTVFDSSFIGENITKGIPFDKKNYTIVPLKIYMGKKLPSKYPRGWSYSDIGTIKRVRVPDIPGLYSALLGMKEGNEKIVKLNASVAFGKKVHEGLIFNTSSILGFMAEFEIVSIDEKNQTVDLKWIPHVGEIIPPSDSLPELYYAYENVTINGAYFVWENKTQIVWKNNTHIKIKTTPDKLKNLTIPLIPYENATFIFYGKNFTQAWYDDKKIYIKMNPPMGNFTNIVPYGYYQITINGRVTNISEKKIQVELYYKNQTTNETEVYKMNLSRLLTFDREQVLPILTLKHFSSFAIENDLKEMGYTFHELAGKTVYFRVKLIRVYRIE